MNPLELGCQGFHVVPPSQSHITFILIFKIKASTYFKCEYQVTLVTLLVFVDVGEDSIMANDVTTPLIALAMLIKEASFDMNVF
jgi:hypothetical protein